MNDFCLPIFVCLMIVCLAMSHCDKGLWCDEISLSKMSIFIYTSKSTKLRRLNDNKQA
jgi:hypothetical protein